MHALAKSKRILFWIYASVACLGVLIVSFFVVVRLLNGAQEGLVEVNERRLQSYLLADQLRQSSDDLTRLVRSHAATQSLRFKSQFQRVLDIRDGKVPRPENYDRVYWDFLAIEGRKPPFPLGEAVSLEQLMRKGGFTHREFELLEVSRRRSDALVSIEEMAFRAVLGEFQDEFGAYTVSGSPNAEMALDFLYSNEYLKAKIGIMEPINEFYRLVDQRTAQEVESGTSKVVTFQNVAVLLFTALLLLFVAVMILVRLYNRAAVAQLSESEAKFRDLVETSQDLIWRCDIEGRLTYLNPAWEQTHGYRLDEMIGRRLTDFQTPEVADRDRAARERYLGDGRSFVYETTHVAKSGRVLVLSFSATFKKDEDENVVGTQGTARDLTEQRKDEKLIETQRRQLIQADKLASLGTLVAGVAHEINNPNNAIRLNARRLKEAWTSILPILQTYYEESGEFLIAGIDYTVMKDDMGTYIADLSHCSSRINRIVEDLKGFYRQEATATSAVDVNRVVNSAAALMKGYIEDHTRYFNIELDETIPEVDGDFQKLEQVIVNLLTNACQALSGKDEAISIRTYYLPREQCIQIEMKDTGVGIAKEHLAELKDPFYSTKQGSGGTGLGLSISDTIVRTHGGTLRVASVLGKGTTATIRLPALPSFLKKDKT